MKIEEVIYVGVFQNTKWIAVMEKKKSYNLKKSIHLENIEKMINSKQEIHSRRKKSFYE